MTTKDIYKTLASRIDGPMPSADEAMTMSFDMMASGAIGHWLRSDTSEPKTLVSVARRIAIEAESDKEAGSRLGRFFANENGVEYNEVRAESFEQLWAILARHSMMFIDWEQVARHYRESINPPPKLAIHD